MNKLNYRIIFLQITTLLLFFSCNHSAKKEYKDQVVINSAVNPKGLNPHTTNDALALNAIIPNIFQSLLNYDHQTMQLVPVLAKSRPVIRTNGNLYELDFELRKEAKWDNGTSVTIDDILFSFKTVFCPKINSEVIKPNIDFITDIKTDSNNTKKFTVVCTKNIALEDQIGTSVFILPEYVYDPNKTLRKYKLSSLISGNKQAEKDANIIGFAENFNSEKFAREAEFVKGSGAYKLISFKTSERLILEKKQNWWGNVFKNENEYFNAYPNQLIFEIINDYTTALTALLDEKIDFIIVTPPKEYIDLDNSPKFKQNFKKHEPALMSYQAIGINMQDKILQDKKVRQALCYLTDNDRMIDKLLYGKAIRTVGSILPMKKNAYNTEIKPYAFDVEKATKLLNDAGWKDTDGDGFLDKIIDGKTTKLELTYTYATGNPLRENIGLVIQQSYKKAGISLKLQALEWALFQEELKKHNCQLYYVSNGGSPAPDDEKQIFYTSSAQDGSNYGSFGNATTDALLDKIRTEMDEKKRNILYKQWQQIEHEEVPFVFLFVQNLRICIHNRFDIGNIGSIYPSVWFASFKVKEGFKLKNLPNK
jgi:peptide/nickel transport system substrate-binding protein